MKMKYIKQALNWYFELWEYVVCDGWVAGILLTLLFLMAHFGAICALGILGNLALTFTSETLVIGIIILVTIKNKDELRAKYQELREWTQSTETGNE